MSFTDSGARAARGRALVSLCKADGPAALVLFPYAGAGPNLFHPLARALGARVPILAVQAPGHGMRVREAPRTDLVALAGELEDELAEVAGPDTIFFGHSLGGLLAFEAARRLEARGGGVGHLVVAGCRAPDVPFPGTPRYLLSDAELVAAMIALGARRDPFDVPELRGLFVPLLRADLALVETYRHTPGAPLACPITALAGAQDVEAPPPTVEAWRRHTRAVFDLQVFDHGHFFFEPCLGPIAELLGRLAAARGG